MPREKESEEAMDGCGVCVSFGGGEECIGYRCVIVKAGQDWECSECGTKIAKGAQYELASWFYADRSGHGNCKTCLICAEIADAFMCGGRYHSSSFWEHMEDTAYPKLTTACFERLKTSAAKAELQRRWIEWKGLGVR
jgi:hypothetical protein